MTAQEKAKKFGVEKVYTSFDEMVKNQEIDSVQICTPNSMHYQQAKAALEAGKHGICEKSLTATELLLKDPPLLSEEVRKITSFPGGHNEGLPDTFKQNFIKVYQAIAKGSPADNAEYPTFAAGLWEIQLCEKIVESRRNTWTKTIDFLLNLDKILCVNDSRRFYNALVVEISYRTITE